MNIETSNDEKNLIIKNIDFHNTPSYHGSTANTLSNRDKKNIRNVMKCQKIQITDADLTSHDLKYNFYLNNHNNYNNVKNFNNNSKISTDKFENVKNNPNNKNKLGKLNNNQQEKFIFNNFEETFDKNNNKNKINHYMNISEINPNNYNLKKDTHFSYSRENNHFNSKTNKKHHISKSIDNPIFDRQNSRKNSINNNNIINTPQVSNEKSYFNICNITNSSAIINTSDFEFNYMKTTTNNHYKKNFERSREKVNSIYSYNNNNLNKINHKNNINNFNNSNYKNSYKSKLNLKLNNKNLLKKSHNNKISINISSIQSPDHKAIYKIEKIENHDNGEIRFDGFDDFKNPDNLNKKTQASNIMNIIELQECSQPNLFTNNNKNQNNKIKITKEEKNQKLNFDDFGRIENNLNDRVQRAFSNSPIRMQTKQNNGNFNKNPTNTKISDLRKETDSHILNFKNIEQNLKSNEIHYNCFQFNNERLINSSNNFYNNLNTKNNYDYSISKNKDSDHEEYVDLDVVNSKNLIVKNQQRIENKNLVLEINYGNFKTPINRKSRSRLNTSDFIFEKHDLEEKIKYNIPVSENKSSNNIRNLIPLTNSYNPKLNFLKERYGEHKFCKLLELLENSENLNQTLNDNLKIKNIVGEDYKIAKNFLKTISNEIFPNRKDSSPSKSII